MKSINRFFGVNTILGLVVFGILSASSASAQYILNQTAQQTADFNISGTGTANIFNAVTQYNINGVRSLAANNGNTFAGWYAGASTTNVVNASFYGAFAGYNNTTGSGNSFFGAFSGYFNSSGYSNSFFGEATGYSNTNGVQNLFAGFQSGRNNTTGSNNTFTGSGAGYSNTTGSNNTALGASANVASGGLTYATAIGAGAIVSTSNTILLGRTDGSDKVRIYGLGLAGSTSLCRNGSFQISTCSSSLRYKINVTPFSSGLALIKQLSPIAFEWKDGGMKDVGFGAEDVARINPLFVSYNEKGEVEGVKYDRLSVAFVNAFKEQQAQIDAQAEQIRQQQQTIEALRKFVCGQNPRAEICKK